jgi:hypothetical protein
MPICLRRQTNLRRSFLDALLPLINFFSGYDQVELDPSSRDMFKHTTAGNNLKPFRVRTAYANAGIVGGQGTTTLLGGDEADDDETDQAEDEAAALEAEGGEVEGENEIFPDKSYIPEDRMFAVVV